MKLQQQPLWAVTDQFVVIPLKVRLTDETEDGIRITTDIVGKSGEHQVCHHRQYFKEMWLDDGVPSNPKAFTSKRKAYDEAIAAAEYKQSTILNELDRVRARLKHLNDPCNF